MPKNADSDDLIDALNALAKHGADLGQVLVSTMAEPGAGPHSIHCATRYCSNVKTSGARDLLLTLEEYKALKANGRMCLECSGGFALSEHETKDRTKAPRVMMTHRLDEMNSFLEMDENPPSDLAELDAWVLNLWAGHTCVRLYKDFPGIDKVHSKAAVKLDALLSELYVHYRQGRGKAKLLGAVARLSLNPEKIFSGVDTLKEVSLNLDELTRQYCARAVEELVATPTYVAGQLGLRGNLFAKANESALRAAILVWFDDSPYQQIPYALFMALRSHSYVFDTVEGFALIDSPMTAPELETFRVFMSDAEGSEEPTMRIYEAAVSV